MNILRILLTCLLLPAAVFAQADKAPAAISLPDQHDQQQAITFPARRVTIISVADRFGREEANQWTPVLDKWKERANIHGIADAKGTPGFLKEAMRKKIAAAHRRTLLIDWNGGTCAALGAKPKVANLLIIKPDGTIAHRMTGPASEANVKAFTAALNLALGGKK